MGVIYLLLSTVDSLITRNAHPFLSYQPTPTRSGVEPISPLQMHVVVAKGIMELYRF